MLPLRRLLPAATAIASVLAVPAAAGAQTFKDRVIEGSVAHAAQAPPGATTARYPTADGLTIPVTAVDPAVAQRYASFVGNLPHGAELASLHILVVPSSEVASACGGDDGDGILACYGAGDQTMIVPAEPTSGSDGITTDYVITHEYGHHIAAHRSNAPLDAMDFGPKRWSSYELVCSNTLDGRLAPGDEGENYFSNPGEGWAEAYARLVYPGMAWRFTSLLKPNQGSLLAAMADVAQPWRTRVSQTFSGTGTHSFKLPLTLDGAFTLQLDGPRRAQYDIIVRSGGRVLEKTSRAGSSDRIHYRIACRDRRTEQLNLTVIKRSGPGGTYSLKASYAG